MQTTERKEKALEDGLVQTIFRPCANFLLRQVELRPGDRVLDVGCGSGIVARAAIEQQPKLKAAHGFDCQAAAVNVACAVRSRHPGADKLDFWTGDALDPTAYRGVWDVVVAQHVLQQAPGLLVPLRGALRTSGTALITTWPESSAECPAYDFLYRASGEAGRQIGLSLDTLEQAVRDAGLRVLKAMNAQLLTTPVKPIVFLRQYLDGKQTPPPNIDSVLNGAAARQAVNQLGSTDGGVSFRISMNVVVAST